MPQDYKSNYKDDKPHVFLPIVIWIVTGLLTWNFIDPQSFWGGILFIIVWVILGNIMQFIIGSLVAIIIDSFERRPKRKKVSFNLEKYRKTNHETALLVAITRYMNADFDEADNYIAGYAYYLIQKGDKDRAYKVLNSYMNHHDLTKFGMEKFAKDFENNRTTYTIKEKEIFDVLIKMINNISNQFKNKNAST